MVIARRVTQEPVEVAEQASAAARRVTQEPVEVAEQASAAARRVTQIAVEVPRITPTRSLTQLPVEVGGRATGGAFSRRMTQIVLEVGYVQPVQPFGEQAGPWEEPWTPAYIQPPVESEAGIYGRLHGHNIILGVPGVRFGRG